MTTQTARANAARHDAFPKGTQGFRLLTPGNPKTAKGRSIGYWTFILHLAPADLSGFNVCPMATQGCRAACLNTAGRGGMIAGYSHLTEAMIRDGILNTIQKARIRRTRAFFEHRAEFMAVLCADIRRAIAMATREGFIPVFRLNGTSDIRWENIPSGNHRNVFEQFDDIQFYDYTKIANRKNIPHNYSLTFSLAENNDKQAYAALNNGMNVAAVFRDKATVSRYEASGFEICGQLIPVINGDDTDLRFLDGKGKITALYAKGNAKTDTSGFVRD